MVCNGYSILHEVLRVTNNGNRSPLEKCEEILTILERSLPLAGAFFWYPEDVAGNGKNFLGARGSDAFPPCERPVVSRSEPSRPRAERPLQSDVLHFPAINAGREAGVLTLVFQETLSGPRAIESWPGCVSLVLADQLRRHFDLRSQRREFRYLALLSDLARALGNSATTQSLLDALWSVLETAGGVACAMLRPMHGSAVLGTPRVRVASHRQSDLPLFEKIESTLAPKVLEDRQMVSMEGMDGSATIAGLPLVFQGHMCGTLFLAGDGRSGALELASPEVSGSFFDSMAAQVAQHLERIEALEDRALLLRENTRKLHEISLLYRISRAIHSTLRLDELMHLILSAVTIPWGGGFGRAMLFMANERSGVLQGMVGVTHHSARFLFSRKEDEAEWVLPLISGDAREKQRQDPFCQLVMKQRLPLSPGENPLARALTEDRLIFVADTRDCQGSFARLAESVGLNACALVPLQGRSRSLGVLVVDSASLPGTILMERRRFLELFANQAAQAMENSMLLHRLETSHRDLRETQERLIQGEKMAALGETAASVTHELRNPLVTIGGFARRLERSLPENTQAREYSGIIVREVKRMEEMLTNILGFSKKQMLCIADCDLIKVIEEVLILEEDALREGNVRLVKEFCEEVPAIRGDEQKLRQVMINLVDNARQAMGDGGALIVRVYRSSLRGDGAVAVEVEDTGGGIPANILRNIFNPFFTTRKQGTGLGLPIVHRIIDHHQGEIEVQNTERGARFVLRLPETPPSHQVLDRHRPFN
jgi:signal transduction histidine kinase